MPRTKKSVDAPKKADVNAGRKYYLPAEAKWGGFIDLRLDEQQKAEFLAWAAESPATWTDDLQEMLAEGLNLSIKFDAENSTFIASVMGAGITNSNERYCLTARSDVWTEALALVVYKHVVLMDGAWDDFLPKTGRLRQWG